MYDQKAWTLALARFHALRSNLPHSITEARVAEYHSILSSLEAASGEDFADFRIPPSDMQPEASGIAMGWRNQHKITYSKELYGDEESFKRQVDGAARYVRAIESSQIGSADMIESKDYWSMTDDQLEALASRYNIGGYGNSMGIDRNIIISQLHERDRALQPEAPPVQHHTISVGSMTGSVIQQGASRSSATLASPAPKSRSFSMGGLTEKVVGSLIGAGLLFLIARLAHHIWH
jgi:hypothetical protein